MRDQLRALEGTLVHYEGLLTERVRQADGTFDLCLVNVEIRPHCTDRPLREIPPVKVGHIWLQGLTEKQILLGEMLKEHAGLAHVRWYTRLNQTVDLGLLSTYGLAWPLVFAEVEGHPKDALAILRTALEQIDEEHIPHWGWANSAQWCESQARDFVARELRDLQINAVTYMTAPSNGPCTRLKKALRLPARQRTAAHGFA